MSALDTEPPEIPDFPEDDDDNSVENPHHSTFDKFGTFQGHAADFDLDTQSSGISSLVTPYGGFDDVMENSANKTGDCCIIVHNKAPFSRVCDIISL